MSDDKEKTRHQILGELESIKHLLDQEDGPSSEPPLLTNPVDEDEAPLLTDILEDLQQDEIPTLQAVPAVELASSSIPAPAPTPKIAEHQPSLFDRNPVSKPEKTALASNKTASSGRGENPFLPKHIRDRLSVNRINDPGQFTPSLEPESLCRPTQPAISSPKPERADEQLVDELVKRFLPDIEAALRERLHRIIRDERKSRDQQDY